MFDAEEARKLLVAGDVFFEMDKDGSDSRLNQVLNMNDTWEWAVADGEYVPDEDLAEVGRLFFLYGHCGLLYWVSERNNQKRSEFEDINRFVNFVRAEEIIRKELPDSSKRAYAKREYALG